MRSQVLRGRLPLVWTILMGAAPAALAVATVSTGSRLRWVLGSSTLFLLVLWIGMVVWGGRRAIVLDPAWLTTRWVARRRIARSSVEGAELEAAVGGGLPVIVHDGGRRTTITMLTARADLDRILDEIRRWAGVSKLPVVAQEGTQETHWVEATPRPTGAIIAFLLMWWMMLMNF